MSTFVMVLTLALVAAASPTAGAAGVAVYKCRQASGATLYTDLPCENGTVLDIRPGASDPSAVARLAAESSEFAENIALRRANDELMETLRVQTEAASYEAPRVDSLNSDATYSDAATSLIYVPVFFHPRVHRRHEFERFGRRQFDSQHRPSVGPPFRERPIPAHRMARRQSLGL